MTYHDPCNIARTGWIVDQPRELLKAFCSELRGDDSRRPQQHLLRRRRRNGFDRRNPPYRMLVGGRVKADQIRATGAKYCVAPCANCKKQLRELMEHHEIDCQIVGLHDLLYKAIVFD